MILIHVTVQAKRDMLKKFELALADIARCARAAGGCIKYEWYRDGDTPNAFVIYGEFDSRASFDAYRASNVVKRIGSELVPLLEAKPEFKHFEAEVFESN